MTIRSNMHDEISWLIQKVEHIHSQIDILNDRCESLEGAILSLHKIFAEYKHKAPKPDSQWTEERLRALEAKVKYVEVITGRMAQALST